jgi:excisionase family DNA binding protein
MSFYIPLDVERVGAITAPHLSVQAAAACSGYNSQYLRRLLRAGKLKGMKVGSIWLIDLDSLEQHLTNALAVDDRRCGPKQPQETGK